MGGQQPMGLQASQPHPLLQHPLPKTSSKGRDSTSGRVKGKGRAKGKGRGWPTARNASQLQAFPPPPFLLTLAPLGIAAISQAATPLKQFLHSCTGKVGEGGALAQGLRRTCVQHTPGAGTWDLVAHYRP